MAVQSSASLDPGSVPLLVTTVDIGDGKVGHIELHPGDDPMVSAQRQWCA